uniref:Uncharacterized protein n=1 Tax=Meloidogyne incognita TaxID=6306 RepID=A0A914LRN5_MELIC
MALNDQIRVNLDHIKGRVEHYQSNLGKKVTTKGNLLLVNKHCNYAYNSLRLISLNLAENQPVLLQELDNIEFPDTYPNLQPNINFPHKNAAQHEIGVIRGLVGNKIKKLLNLIDIGLRALPGRGVIEEVDRKYIGIYFTTLGNFLTEMDPLYL